ncbi:hypothetical protein OPV22_013157 [Ensete ventricosum]|uniref:DUF4005 domain-containing protein n=1 Tax=Ensete ventricosum TaxID=4639 RepID=A0AAV8R380_ENSVE|nr:hypothetical protein OPV22_013157 [Ensete ventricosum]
MDETVFCNARTAKRCPITATTAQRTAGADGNSTDVDMLNRRRTREWTRRNTGAMAKPTMAHEQGFVASSTTQNSRRMGSLPPSKKENSPPLV